MTDRAIEGLKAFKKHKTEEDRYIDAMYEAMILFTEGASKNIRVENYEANFIINGENILSTKCLNPQCK